MKKNIFIISLLFISFNTFSQGYMGHKFGLRYNGLIFPNMANMWNDNSDHIFGLNYTHSFSLAYTFNKGAEVFIEFELFNLDYSINQITIKKNNDSGDTEEYSHLEPTHIKSKSFGFGFRFYSTEWLAPLGFYNQLSLLISSAKAYSTDGKETVIDETVYPRIGWGFGSQRVIAGNLMIDIGVQTYLSFINPLNNNTIQQRLFFRNLASFKLGLTYVL